MNALRRLLHLHDAAFARVEGATASWLPGSLARLIFASVLFGYFLNSARTKVGDGILGFFSVSDSAFYQIALPAVEAAGADVSQVPFLPWGLIVTAGTYAEFALPVLIVLGLFTRLAALGMLVFISVQTAVDISVHQVGSETIGAFFDRFPDDVIADQRLLWAFPLAYLAIRGAGALSLDQLMRLGPAGLPARIPAV